MVTGIKISTQSLLLSNYLILSEDFPLQIINWKEYKINVSIQYIY